MCSGDAGRRCVIGPDRQALGLNLKLEKHYFLKTLTALAKKSLCEAILVWKEFMIS